MAARRRGAVDPLVEVPEREWDELPQEPNGPAAVLLAAAILSYEKTLSLVDGDRATDGDGAEVVVSATFWDALVDHARKVLA